MAATLASLLNTSNVTPQQVFNTMLTFYQQNGFPTQSWQTGGTERTRLMAFATAVSVAAATYIPAFAAGTFLDYAVSDGKGGGWLPLLALEQFNVTQNPAVFTQGNITLTAAAGVASSTYQGGQLIAVFGATGNRYLNVNSITIPAGPGNVTGLFQAEFPGSSYSDPSSSGSISLVTPIPGVTLTNPAGTYSAVAHVGSGTGTLALSGAPTVPHSVTVQINQTAVNAPTAWSYSLDGAPYVSVGSVSSAAIGSSNITVTLTNGGSGTSWALNDTYAFVTPGSWITQSGANIESDPALQQRCRNRWSSLSSIPVNQLYQLLVTSTPTVGAQVTQVVVQTDSVVNNKLNVVVAGPQGALPAGVVSTIQTYVNPRVPQTDAVVIQSPTTQAITYAGTVTVPASQLTAATQAINTALTNYTNGVGINGTLRLSAVIDTVMNVAGVIDFTGATINGSAANLTLGSSVTFVVPGASPTINLGYVTQ